MYKLHTFILLIGLILLSTISGCSTVSTMPVKPKAIINIQAGSTLNLTDNGQSSPLKVQIYQLSSNKLVGKEFAGSESMLANSQAVQTFILFPRQQITLSWILHPDTTMLAVIPHYHYLTQTNWRVLIPVDPSKGKNPIALKFVNQKIYVRKS